MPAACPPLRDHGGAPADPVRYQRRDPEKTLLHQLVREHWRTLLAEIAGRTDGGSLPGHVTAEFERYLQCGLLVHGFARVRCTACGDDLLVAFSCKGRGFCPSCTTRRMQGTALHLLDRVIPHVPVRQWVLSLPHWARFLLARDSRLITGTLQRMLAEVFKLHRRRARKLFAVDPRPGAVTFVQRFGGSLNLNVHLHSVVPDGVFVRSDAGAVSFIALDPPSDEVLAKLVCCIAARVRKLLQPIREAHGQDARPPDPLAAAQADAQASAGRRRRPRPAPKRHEAYFEGFSLHAGVHLHANDRPGLLHLCGYGARPPLSQNRLALLPDGDVQLRLKRARDDGSDALVLKPLELLRRLAAIVPPPRAHLTRFHGVFAPASGWRSAVVPAAAEAQPMTEGGQQVAPAASPEARPSSASLAPAPEAAKTPVEEVHKPSQQGARIPWAQLLRRLFLVDVLACPCGGRRKVIAFIKEAEAVKAILESLGLPATGPPMAPARSALCSDEGWQDDVPTLQRALQ